MLQYIIGSVQLDAAPNITGTFGPMKNYFLDTTGVFTPSNEPIRTQEYGKRDPIGQMVAFNASLSSESYGRNETTEVRPYNVAFLTCRKD